MGEYSLGKMEQKFPDMIGEQALIEMGLSRFMGRGICLEKKDNIHYVKRL